jgi:hypothetical protein
VSRQVVAVAVIRGRDIHVKIHPRYLDWSLELARTIAAVQARRVIRERHPSGERTAPA